VEYRRLVESGQLKDFIVEAPSRPMAIGSTILGFVLMGIGLLLLIFIMVGFASTLMGH
jgi:hypothetical protein